jgi:SH3-like domain-containing protein
MRQKKREHGDRRSLAPPVLDRQRPALSYDPVMRIDVPPFSTARPLFAARRLMQAAGLWALVFLALGTSGLSGEVFSPALAQEQLAGPVTGLPLPRFVSLKADTANVRRGPSTEHEVQWVYKRRGLPVEIVAEFERWRRIRDADGETGWIYYSLLDGERTALLTGSEEIPLYAEPGGGQIVALAEPGVIGALQLCRPRFCQITAKGYTGWAARRHIWGVYPGETLQ